MGEQKELKPNFMKKPYTRLQPLQKNDSPIDPRVDIGHVHLKTANIGRVRQFYVDILGFDIVFQLSTALFLSAGGYHHDLAFNTWESENGTQPPLGTTGLYHVAIRYPDRASLGDAILRLMEAQWPIDGVNDHGTHEAVYLHDPDANGLELYCDRPESEWPIDDQGHLSFTNRGQSFDIESLLVAGRKQRKETQKK